MKILSIGDFHGRFPAKLQKLAKGVDLIISVGDYMPWRLKKIFFEKCFATDLELWEIVGKKKYKESHSGDLKDSEKILEKLNLFKVPVVTTVGNYDTPEFNDTFDRKGLWRGGWKWAAQDFFSPLLKKYSHIKRIDYRAIRIGELVIIGGYGHSFPGRVKSKAYRKSRVKLDKLFKKYSKENREGKVIFAFHNMPYNCKLDKIRDPEADPLVFGKHYGNKLTRRIIDKYPPAICVGGHLHENQGRCKIGKSLVINTGGAFEGKCCVIDFDETKGKVKSVKFVK